MRLYECDICGGLHPVGFEGDCRTDDARFNQPSERDTIEWLDDQEPQSAGR